jgi:NADH-quinone oxidoreductase subunit L
LLLPLFGGLFSYFLPSPRSHWFAPIFVFAGLGFSCFTLFQTDIFIRWSWLPSIEFGLHIDSLAAALITLVYFISLLVHLFSFHYMKDDPGIKRYYFMLGFFTTSMLGLLAADHLILLFLFWELVGFSSYLLIGFWFQESEKATSARIAFMVNRVADAALLIGIILLITVFEQSFISEMASLGSGTLITITGIMLAIGAFGKSAQFPFFGWLNKAMAGPTPVSALIHAATMVTAGIYLLVRMFPVLTDHVLMIIALIGAITAFMAGMSALVQNDIKSVLAYSTISQLGYMILGVGVGAFETSIFHLWTHAFFKAGLFLAAGNIIHFMHHANHKVDAQDMRSMGGLKKYLPFTFIIYIICGAALAGLPFTSGFLSKEGILGATLDWFMEFRTEPISLVVLILAFVTALLTPFYITRQILIVFFDKPRTELNITENHNFEPIQYVKIPLGLLAIGSIWIFSSLNPFNSHGWFLSDFLFGISIETAHQTSGGLYLIIVSVLLVFAGVILSFVKFKPGSNFITNYQSKNIESGTVASILLEGWYIDRLYGLINNGFLNLSNFVFWLDKKVINKVVDGIGVSGIVFAKVTSIIDRHFVDGLVNFFAGFFKRFGKMLSRMQAPGIQTQLATMLLILVILMYLFLFDL